MILCGILWFSLTRSFSSTPQILPGQLLHKVQHNTLFHKHCLTSERPHSKTATATRSQTLWHQQVLTSCPVSPAEVEFLHSLFHQVI